MNKNKKCYLVVQSNKLIEARYSLTLGEQRLILAMVSMIHPDDADFFDYEISMKNLSELLSIDLKSSYREADKITERLMERILHIKKANGGLLKIHWVSSVLHEDGRIVLSFDPKLKPYLSRLKKEFTKYNLSIAAHFHSIYSIRIYQLLKQYKGIGYREFRIDELKEILGLKKTQYSVFKDFDRRVLNQAKKEFEKKDKYGNFKCDLTFALEKIREGRRIARLKFIIIEQEYHEPPLFIPDAAEDKKQTGGESDNAETPPEGVKDQLVYYGISAKQADGFIRQMGEDDIRDVLTYYADLLKAGKVKNTRGAYLAKLLQEGVRVQSSYERDRDAAEELRKRQKDLERQQQELARQRAEEQQKLKNLELEERFNGLPEDDRESLLSEFEDTLERFMLKYFYKDGIRSVVIRGAFFEFLERKSS